MKKILLKYRSLILFLVLFIPFILFAQGTQFDPNSVPSSGGGNVNLNPLKGVNTIWDLLKNIFTALIDIALPIAVLMLVYSGYLFVTAMGDEKQVNSAKENFKWTLIGIAVLLGARALVDLVQQTIGNLN